MGEINLKAWNPKDCPDDALVMIYAKRRSGKSYLLRDIMYHKRKSYDRGIVFSASDGQAENSLSDGGSFPSTFMFRDFDEERLTEIFEEHEATVEYASLHASAEVPKNLNWFVVLDDMLVGSEVRNSKIMKALAARGRHAKVGVYIIAQGTRDLAPKERTAGDVIVIMGTPAEDTVNSLFTNFSSGISKDEFRALVAKCTADYGCLIIDNTCASTTPYEKFKYYRACAVVKRDEKGQIVMKNGKKVYESPHKNWKIGSKSFWKFHNQYSAPPSKASVPAWKISVQREKQKEKQMEKAKEQTEEEECAIESIDIEEMDEPQSLMSNIRVKGKFTRISLPECPMLD